MVFPELENKVAIHLVHNTNITLEQFITKLIKTMGH